MISRAGAVSALLLVSAAASSQSAQPPTPKAGTFSDADKVEVTMTILTAGKVYDKDMKPLPITEQAFLERIADEDLKIAPEACNAKLRDAVKSKDAKAEAYALNCVAQVEAQHGQVREALEHLRRAVALAERINDRALVLLCHSNMGYMYDLMREYTDGLREYEYARALAVTAKNDFETAYCDAGIGSVLNKMGDFGSALRAHQRALDSWKRQGNFEREITSRADIATVQDAMGLHREALETWKEVVAYYEKKAKYTAAVTVLNNMGRAYGEVEEYENATNVFGRALELAEKLQDAASTAIIELNLAMLYERMKQPDREHEALNRANAAAGRSSNSYVQTQITTYRAFSLLRQKKFDEAAAAIGLALNDAERRADKWELSQLWKGLGFAYLGLHNVEASIMSYRRAVDVVEEMRSEAQTPELRIKVASETLEPYVWLGAILRYLKRDAELFDLAERARARAFLDQRVAKRVVLDGASEERRALKTTLDRINEIESLLRTGSLGEDENRAGRSELASLEHQYGQRLAQARITSPDASTAGTARPLSLKEIQRRIPPDTTLIVYTNITGKMTAFVVKPESFETFDLPGVDEDQFETTLAEFHDFGDDDAVPHSSRELYDYLIRPLRARLDSSRLIIVPAGVLHYVPFAALHDGERFLGDVFALSYMPTPSALTSRARVDHTYETTALALATSSAPGFSYIPYAAEAANAIGSLFNTRALIDAEATKPALLKKLAGSRYVLLAAHSTLDKDVALFTRLYLAPSEGDQGYLELHEIQDLQLGCELVVLSGCDTTLGDVTRGNEVSGLSRAFLTAGARAVVASQWEVPDQSTGEVVSALFKHLHDGMTASKALQEAQREVRAKYPAPYYWAGFLVLGEDAPANE